MEKREEKASTPKLFVGKSSCGCVVSICKDGFDQPGFVDMTLDALIEMRGQEGLKIEKMESDIAFELFQKPCNCDTPLFAGLSGKVAQTV